ncbi:hypothetical protein LR48_Vigan11g132700 [Vigna angularis]|uniref:Uncharacterized protein n=1 Tax=Phaseolus angularis TaxID=3914 RepID=A0A0L9VTM7_PHAAN|nr:hypothetical protein LR48_Vigan11g132700 [Vigna angularis]
MPVDISHGDKLESSSSKFRMERSKTERLRHLSPEDAAQIFDDKIPVQDKLKLLNRIATVKDDGTVEFDVPVDVEPEAIVTQSTKVNHVVDDSLDATDFHYIPPLNIVMLIVGTRGDVQPFIAIGKRLQWSTSIVIAVCICPMPIVAVRGCLDTVCSCQLQFEALQLGSLPSRICPPPSAAVRRHCSVRRPLDLVRLFTRRPTPPVPASDSSPRSATRRFFVCCEQARAAHTPPFGRRKVTATPP